MIFQVFSEAEPFGKRIHQLALKIANHKRTIPLPFCEDLLSAVQYTL